MFSRLLGRSKDKDDGGDDGRKAKTLKGTKSRSDLEEANNSNKPSAPPTSSRRTSSPPDISASKSEETPPTPPTTRTLPRNFTPSDSSSSLSSEQKTSNSSPRPTAQRKATEESVSTQQFRQTLKLNQEVQEVHEDDFLRSYQEIYNHRLEEALSLDPPDVAAALQIITQLARVEQLGGSYDEAIDLMGKKLDILEFAIADAMSVHVSNKEPPPIQLPSGCWENHQLFYEYAHTLHTIGSLHLAKNDMDSAQMNLDLSLSQHRRINKKKMDSKPLKVATLALLAIVYEKVGNEAKAVETDDKAISLIPVSA